MSTLFTSGMQQNVLTAICDFNFFPWKPGPCLKGREGKEKEEEMEERGESNKIQIRTWWGATCLESTVRDYNDDANLLSQ